MTARSERLGPQVPLLPDSLDQRIADDGMVLRVLVGSGVYGTSIGGQDDVDEMGICVEPPHTVIGTGRFEHYQYRTQTEGTCSGPGDLDLIVYSLRKFLRLAMSGNPTVLLPLFVPAEHVEFCNDIGAELRNSDWIISQQAGPRFLGYMQSQREGLLGIRAGARNRGRKDIIERYGFDAKFAMHMVRLGIQGVELLTTGRITLPIPEPHLTWLRDLRVGKGTKEDAIDASMELEDQIKRLMNSSPLPTHPDYNRADQWLASAHRRFWKW